MCRCVHQQAVQRAEQNLSGQRKGGWRLSGSKRPGGDGGKNQWRCTIRSGHVLNTARRGQNVKQTNPSEAHLKGELLVLALCHVQHKGRRLQLRQHPRPVLQDRQAYNSGLQHTRCRTAPAAHALPLGSVLC